MHDADELLKILLNSRNTDGGWPSHRGSSWTEPTAMALLALQVTHAPGELRAAITSWLVKRQSSDNGWPPCPAVGTSTWVTSLALLALSREPTSALQCELAARWVASHVYPEPDSLQNFLLKTFHLAPNKAPGSAPWFPDTAGWVIPTAFSALALNVWGTRTNNKNLQNLAYRAQSYLLSRRCPDGGWNHGGSLQRSEQSTSYGETTGLALTALESRVTEIKPAISLSRRLLDQAESTEGQCWLSIGLATCGISTPPPIFNKAPHTTQETALRILAHHVTNGRNPFLPRSI